MHRRLCFILGIALLLPLRIYGMDAFNMNAFNEKDSFATEAMNSPANLFRLPETISPEAFDFPEESIQGIQRVQAYQPGKGMAHTQTRFNQCMHGLYNAHTNHAAGGKGYATLLLRETTDLFILEAREHIPIFLRNKTTLAEWYEALETMWKEGLKALPVNPPLNPYAQEWNKELFVFMEAHTPKKNYGLPFPSFCISRKGGIPFATLWREVEKFLIFHALEEPLDEEERALCLLLLVNHLITAPVYELCGKHTLQAIEPYYRAFRAVFQGLKAHKKSLSSILCHSDINLAESNAQDALDYIKWRLRSTYKKRKLCMQRPSWYAFSDYVLNDKGGSYILEFFALSSSIARHLHSWPGCSYVLLHDALSYLETHDLSGKNLYVRNFDTKASRLMIQTMARRDIFDANEDARGRSMRNPREPVHRLNPLYTSKFLVCLIHHRLYPSCRQIPNTSPTNLLWMYIWSAIDAKRQIKLPGTAYLKKTGMLRVQTPIPVYKACFSLICCLDRNYFYTIHGALAPWYVRTIHGLFSYLWEEHFASKEPLCTKPEQQYAFKKFLMDMFTTKLQDARNPFFHSKEQDFAWFQATFTDAHQHFSGGVLTSTSTVCACTGTCTFQEDCLAIKNKLKLHHQWDEDAAIWDPLTLCAREAIQGWWKKIQQTAPGSPIEEAIQTFSDGIEGNQLLYTRLRKRHVPSYKLPACSSLRKENT